MILMKESSFLLSFALLSIIVGGGGGKVYGFEMGSGAGAGDGGYAYQPVDLSGLEHHHFGINNQRGTSLMNPSSSSFNGMMPGNNNGIGFNNNNNNNMGMSFGTNGMNPGFMDYMSGVNGMNDLVQQHQQDQNMQAQMQNQGRSRRRRGIRVPRVRSPFFQLDNRTVMKIRTSFNSCKRKSMLKYHKMFKDPQLLLLFLRDMHQMMQRPKIKCSRGHFRLTGKDRQTLLRDPYFRRSLKRYLKKHPEAILQVKQLQNSNDRMPRPQSSHLYGDFGRNFGFGGEGHASDGAQFNRLHGGMTSGDER